MHCKCSLWLVGATRRRGGGRVAPDNSWEGQGGGAGVGEVTPILYGGGGSYTGDFLL